MVGADTVQGQGRRAGSLGDGWLWLGSARFDELWRTVGSGLSARTSHLNTLIFTIEPHLIPITSANAGLRSLSYAMSRLQLEVYRMRHHPGPQKPGRLGCQKGYAHADTRRECCEQMDGRGSSNSLPLQLFVCRSQQTFGDATDR